MCAVSVVTDPDCDAEDGQPLTAPLWRLHRQEEEVTRLLR